MRFSSILILLLFLTAADLQAQQLHLFAGRSAPAAQDADLFSRAYRSGLTVGIGGSKAVTERLSLEGTLTYSRLRTETPDAALQNLLANPGTLQDARFLLSSPRTAVSLETNAQYTFRPSRTVQPYAVAGVVQRMESSEGLHVESTDRTFRTPERSGYSLGVQTGLGLQVRLGTRLHVFAESLAQFVSSASHTLPVRTGISVQL